MAKFFNVRVTGLDGIRKDVYRVKKSLKTPIENGLRAVGDEMADVLQRHIHDDWLADPWKPVQYIRRTNGEGIGLGDRSNIKPTVTNGSLLFDFSPSTEHYVDEWDDHNPDLMIYRIENNDKWKYPPSGRADPETGVLVPIRPRPFWHNFLDEIKSTHNIYDAFKTGFGNVENVQLRMEGGNNDVVWEAGEGEIDGNDLGSIPDPAFNSFSTFGKQYDAFGNEVDEYFYGGWDGDEIEL